MSPHWLRYRWVIHFGSVLRFVSPSGRMSRICLKDMPSFGFLMWWRELSNNHPKYLIKCFTWLRFGESSECNPHPGCTILDCWNFHVMYAFLAPPDCHWPPTNSEILLVHLQLQTDIRYLSDKIESFIQGCCRSEVWMCILNLLHFHKTSKINKWRKAKQDGCQ